MVCNSTRFVISGIATRENPAAAIVTSSLPNNPSTALRECRKCQDRDRRSNTPPTERHTGHTAHRGRIHNTANSKQYAQQGKKPTLVTPTDLSQKYFKSQTVPRVFLKDFYRRL